MNTNLTAVLYGMKDLRVEDKPIPQPKDDEVLLRMACVGICGSDVHYYIRGSCGEYKVNDPMIIGHEASGIVQKVGKNVNHLKEGDRVAIEPGVSCLRCKFCLGGRYNLCPEMRFCATPPIHGNLAQYYVHPAHFCFKLPEHVSLEEGALLEPLAVGVHACKRAGVGLGSTVLITGSGPIGLVTVIAAKAMGASNILITGSHPESLTVAKKLGADDILLVSKSEDPKQLSKRIIEIMRERPEITIDCVGTEASIRLGLEVTEWGGVFVIVGFAAEEVTTPLIPAAAREVDIKGIFRYANDYPTALALVASGKVDVKQLITHKFLIKDSVAAFDAAHNKTGNPIKIMIYCDDEKPANGR